MKSVAIAGASGVVGSRVLHRLLQRDDVERVVALGRRVLTTSHPKLVSEVVALQDKASVAGALPDGVDAAFCCLGTTMKRAGSKEAFRAIDHDAVVGFAAGALEKGAERFLLVSSVGASRRTRNFYLHTKGEAEEAVARLGYAQVTVLRPSFIDDQGARGEFRAAERLALLLARAVFSVVGRTSRYAPIPADVIAAAMVRLAFDDTVEGLRIVESDRLHALGR